MAKRHHGKAKLFGGKVKHRKKSRKKVSRHRMTRKRK